MKLGVVERFYCCMIVRNDTTRSVEKRIIEASIKSQSSRMNNVVVETTLKSSEFSQSLLCYKALICELTYSAFFV